MTLIGIKAITFLVEKKKDLIPNRFPCEFICEAMEIILKNNVSTTSPIICKPNYGILRRKHVCKIYSKVQQYNGRLYKVQLEKILDDCQILWNTDRADIH